MVQHTDTHMGTHTHMGKARVLAHTRMGQPVRVSAAHMCMGRIPIWDGTYTATELCRVYL